MTATDKPKIPRAEALKIAGEIYNLLNPWCDKCKVVGSLRRRRPYVKDVEFLFIGTTLKRTEGLFDVVEFNAGLWRIDDLVQDLVIKPRPNVKGIIAWGEKNRLAIHVESGIPIDFFCATPETWWNMLVCRTGGAASNTQLAQAYLDRGLKWHPYGVGYTDLKGHSFPNLSEEDVFKNAGLPCLPPERRP